MAVRKVNRGLHLSNDTNFGYGWFHLNGVYRGQGFTVENSGIVPSVKNKSNFLHEVTS